MDECVYVCPFEPLKSLEIVAYCFGSVSIHLCVFGVTLFAHSWRPTAHFNGIFGPIGVPFGWGEWSAWSTCSTTCGNGAITRSRDCVGTCGATCVGKASESVLCTNVDACDSTSTTPGSILSMEWDIPDCDEFLSLLSIYTY